MRNVLRLILSLVKWTALTAGGLLLFVVVVNAFDEAPSPDATALAQVRPLAVTDANNAYLALVGFDAPVGMEPIEEGRRLVAEHDVKAGSQPWNAYEPESTKITAGKVNARLRFAGDRKAACDPFGSGAPVAALARANELHSLHAANEVLVNRYLAIQRLTGFAVTALPSIMQPVPVGDWSAVQQVLLCEVAADTQTGRATEALAFLGDDLRFWRRVLAGDGNLISEMIAVAYLARDLHVLSALIATTEFPADAHAAMLRRMLTPLEAPERGTTHMFVSEYAMHMALYRDLWEAPMRQPAPEEDAFESKVERMLWSKHVAGHFYKTQASLNLSARNFTQLIALANAGPAGFIAERARLHAYLDEHGAFEPDIVYNPVGKILVGIAQPYYDDYIARVFDLAAYLQLVRAQLEVRLASVPSDRLQKFLAEAPKETRNPYTDTPFTWDVTKGTLSFEPQSQRWREWATTVPIVPGTLTK